VAAALDERRCKTWSKSRAKSAPECSLYAKGSIWKLQRHESFWCAFLVETTENQTLPRITHWIGRCQKAKRSIPLPALNNDGLQLFCYIPFKSLSHSSQNGQPMSLRPGREIALTTSRSAEHLTMLCYSVQPPNHKPQIRSVIATFGFSRSFVSDSK
jgi:hypothetical protein